MEARRSKRRSLRRAVELECAVQSDFWEGLVALPASDVSNEGLWVDTPYALDPGEELVVAFAPPGARPGEELWALAEVARVGLWRRREDAYRAGMGLSFTYFNEVDRRFLARSLVGRPPRLPRRAPPPLPHDRRQTQVLPKAPVALSLDDVVFEDDLLLKDRDVPWVLDADLAGEWQITPLAELFG